MSFCGHYFQVEHLLWHWARNEMIIDRKSSIWAYHHLQCMWDWTRHFHLYYNHLKIPDKGVAGMSDGLTPLATKGLTNWLQDGGGGMLWRRPTCKEIRTAHILCLDAAFGLISARNFTFHCFITGTFDMDPPSPSSNPQLKLNPGSANPSVPARPVAAPVCTVQQLFYYVQYYCTAKRR